MSRSSSSAVAALCLLLALFPGPLFAQSAPTELAPIEALLRQGRFAEAERALAALPGAGAEADYLLGFALIQLYRYAEAEEALQRAVAARPGRDDWLHALAKAEQEQGKNLAAIAILDRAIAISDQPRYRFARAMCALNVGDLDSGERDLRRSLEVEPRQPEASYKLGKIHVDRGDYAAAMPALAAALELEPTHLEARFLLGLAASRSGDLTTAEAALEAVIEAVPGHVGALYNSGRVLIQLGREEEGRRRLKRFGEMSELSDRIDFTTRAVRKNPRNFPGRLELARLLLEAGRTEEALAELTAARPLEPRQPRIYRMMAEAFRRLGRAQDAARAQAFAARLEGSS